MSGRAAPAESEGPVPATFPTAPPTAGGVASDPPFRAPSLRAALGILLVFVLLGGVAYPLVVDGFGRATGGFDPNGQFVPGGDAGKLASTLLGQNITNDSLFWPRPSLDDYNTTAASGESPYGPTDPELVNQTVYYLALYGLNASSAPLQLVSNSASGLDPDLDPAAALVQIPRIASHTNLSQAFLTQFVLDRVHAPFLGFLGPPYVNVLSLDLALIALLHPPKA